MNPYYSGANITGTNSSMMLLKWSPTKWAQLGWLKSKIQDGVTTKRQVFIEFYLSASQNYYRFWSGRTVQTQTWYEILNDGSDFDFFVGGTYYASYSGFTPTDYQMFSETHDLADQMPGLSSNVQTFRNAGYFTSPGHTWHTMTSAISTNTTYYGAQKPANGVYYVWDKCTSGAAAAQPNGQESALSTQPALNTSPLIEQADLKMLGMVTADEVIDSQAGSQAAAWRVSIDEALEIATREMGRAEGMRVYMGTASRFPDDPVRPVWIVTRPGGTPPSAGPVGGPDLLPIGFTGVIIDSASGEVWSGFMH